MKRLALLAVSLVLSLALVAGGTAVSAPGAGGDGASAAAKKKGKKKKQCGKGKTRAKKGPKKGKCVKKKKKSDGRICAVGKPTCFEMKSSDGSVVADITYGQPAGPHNLTFPPAAAQARNCSPPPSDPLGQQVLANFTDNGSAQFSINGAKPGATISGQTAVGGGGTIDRRIYYNHTVEGKWTSTTTIQGTVTSLQVREYTDGRGEIDRCSNVMPFVIKKSR